MRVAYRADRSDDRWAYLAMTAAADAAAASGTSPDRAKFRTSLKRLLRIDRARVVHLSRTYSITFQPPSSGQTTCSQFAAWPAATRLHFCLQTNWKPINHLKIQLFAQSGRIIGDGHGNCNGAGQRTDLVPVSLSLECLECFKFRFVVLIFPPSHINWP